MFITKGFDYFKKGFEHVTTGGVFECVFEYVFDSHEGVGYCFCPVKLLSNVVIVFSNNFVSFYPKFYKMGKLKNFVLLHVQSKINVKFKTCRVFFMFGASHQKFGLSISSRDISRSLC